MPKILYATFSNMFLHKRFVVGLLAFWMLFQPIAASAIYEQMRTVTRQEFMLDQVEDDISSFIQDQNVFKIDPQLSSQDINDSVQNRSDKICARREEKAVPCGIALPVTKIAKRETRVRTLARDLQIIASGYELPITEHPYDPVAVLPRMPSIIGMWQATNDWLVTPIVERRIRSM
ncbi:MAG: hypothetical protein WCX61_00535, partial [Candidatus Peribacteraceae bacterium]